jgi:Inorganic Pyrophosphatase/Protein of unknown function (DUF935)
MTLDFKSRIDTVISDPMVLSEMQYGLSRPEDEYLMYRLGGDYRKYLEMRSDSHIRSQLAKRRQAVTGRKLNLRTIGKRRADIDGLAMAEALMPSIAYDGMCSKLLHSAYLIGFSVCQMDMIRQGKYLVPSLRFIPQRRWAFAFPVKGKDVPTATGKPMGPGDYIEIDGYELRLLTREYPFSGVRVPVGRFVVHSFEADHHPAGLGLGYSIYPWYLVKREARKAWLMQAGRAGNPPAIGKTPAELDEDDPKVKRVIQDFDSFLQGLSPENWGRFPEGYLVEFLKNEIDPGSADRLMVAADGQISKVVLGEVAFSDKASSSYAANASQVADRETTMTDSDCSIFDEQMQAQFWDVVQELNYPRLGRVLVAHETIADKREADAKDQEGRRVETQARTDKAIKDLGLEFTPEHVQREYGDDWKIPAPEPETPPPSIDDVEANVTFGEKISRKLYWQGLTIAVEHEVGSVRFDKPMVMGYGYVEGFIGDDREPLDVYLGPYLDALHIFRVDQLKPDGTHDEFKFMLFFGSMKAAIRAYKAQTVPGMFGGCDEISLSELQQYKKGFLGAAIASTAI